MTAGKGTEFLLDRGVCVAAGGLSKGEALRAVVRFLGLFLVSKDPLEDLCQGRDDLIQNTLKGPLPAG